MRAERCGGGPAAHGHGGGAATTRLRPEGAALRAVGRRVCVVTPRSEAAVPSQRLRRTRLRAGLEVLRTPAFLPLCRWHPKIHHRTAPPPPTAPATGALSAMPPLRARASVFHRALTAVSVLSPPTNDPPPRMLATMSPQDHPHSIHTPSLPITFSAPTCPITPPLFGGDRAMAPQPSTL